jgi:hypothetical protein
MKSKKRCSSSCLTGGHKSWGECVRAKGVQLSPAVNGEYGARQKAWDKELDSYADARRQGVEPRGTKQHLIDEAMETSQATGVAYQA